MITRKQIYYTVSDTLNELNESALIGASVNVPYYLNSQLLSEAVYNYLDKNDYMYNSNNKMLNDFYVKTAICEILNIKSSKYYVNYLLESYDKAADKKIMNEAKQKVLLNEFVVTLIIELINIIVSYGGKKFIMGGSWLANKLVKRIINFMKEHPNWAKIILGAQKVFMWNEIQDEVLDRGIELGYITKKEAQKLEDQCNIFGKKFHKDYMGAEGANLIYNKDNGGTADDSNIGGTGKHKSMIDKTATLIKNIKFPIDAIYNRFNKCTSIEEKMLKDGSSCLVLNTGIVVYNNGRCKLPNGQMSSVPKDIWPEYKEYFEEINGNLE